MAYAESGTTGSHTHTYSKTTSVSITGGTLPSMKFNTGDTSDNKYAYSVTDSTIGWTATTGNTTAPQAGASNASASTTVAAHSHTHSYKKTTGVTLNAGTAPSLTDSETTSTGAISYLKSYNISGGDWSATKAKFSASINYTDTNTDATTHAAVNAVTELNAGDVTTKYFYPVFNGAQGTVNQTTSTAVSAVTGLTSGEFDITTKWMTASFTGSSGLSTSATLSTTDVPSLAHTHGVSISSAPLTLAVDGTAANNGVSFVSAVSQTQKYFAATPSIDTTTSTATVATSGHTHTVTPAGTIALSLANNSDTGKVGVITSVGAGTTSYLTASTSSVIGTTSVAASGHTHKYTPAGSVSLNLDNVSTGDALVTGLDKN